jgi:hypothetical protein
MDELNEIYAAYLSMGYDLWDATKAQLRMLHEIYGDATMDFIEGWKSPLDIDLLADANGLPSYHGQKYGQGYYVTARRHCKEFADRARS